MRAAAQPRTAFAMVEHRYRDPQIVDILESEVDQRLTTPRAGRCLICGEWIEADTERTYEIAIGRRGVVDVVSVAHERCLAEAAHPSATLP